MPKIRVVSTDATVKAAEFGAVITVGHPDTAKRLTKQLGHKVVIGDKIDLGIIATYNHNPVVNLWNQLKMRFQKVRIIHG